MIKKIPDVLGKDLKNACALHQHAVFDLNKQFYSKK